MKKLAIALVAVAAIGGVACSSGPPPVAKPLVGVARTCGLIVADNGTTIAVEFTDVSADGAVCVLDALPTFVVSQLIQASANAPVTVTWGKYTANATYNGYDGTGQLTVHGTGPLGKAPAPPEGETA